jgi:hypothetical protein
MVGEPNNKKTSLGVNESTYLNRETKIGLAYLCLREIDLCTTEPYTIRISLFQVKVLRYLINEVNRREYCFCCITTVTYRRDRAEIDKVLRGMSRSE